VLDFDKKRKPKITVLNKHDYDMSTALNTTASRCCILIRKRKPDRGPEEAYSYP